jgi:putative membrane protein insertion efficiency factor
MNAAGKVVAAIALAPIWVYRRVVSPLMPRTCRYYPSCSAYAEEAVRTHGAVRGLWLAVRRLARCHPWTPGGVDHVPPARAERDHPATPVTGA